MEVVITGIRTFVRKTNSPVIVNVLSSGMLECVQACNLSEGLKFQPGLRVKSKKPKLKMFGGVKNILDAYQEDFDSGKNRDSNYVYGPATPRTVFIGLKLGNF